MCWTEDRDDAVFDMEDTRRDLGQHYRYVANAMKIPAPEFELPPGEATLLCDCGFESDPFCFIEHLYRCSNCKIIDSPSKVPFVYSPPACSKCNRQFVRQDRIHAGHMKPAYLHAERHSDWSPDFTPCPICENKTLAINSLGVDYQVHENDHVTPNVGDTLHARTMKSDDARIPIFLWSPRLASEFSLSLIVNNREFDTIDDGHHEFRVVEVGETAPRLTLEYLRELPPSEWKWYTGTHGIAT